MGGLAIKERPVVAVGISNQLDPLSTRTQKTFAPGVTVRECLMAIWPLFPSGRSLVVAIDGEVCTNAESALDVTLGSGQSVVFAAKPGKGGGGGKNVFSTVSTIALMVAAPQLGAWAMSTQFGAVMANVGVGLGIGVGGGLALGSALVGGAFTLGAGALISGFVGTGATSTSASAATSVEQDSPSWSDAPNPVEEGGPWPVGYGTYKIKPRVISWHKTYDGESQYLHWLGAVGDHGVDSYDEVYINGNPLSFYGDSVEAEYRYGELDQEVISFFNETISEKSVNFRVSTDYATARTDGNACQGLSVVLGWSQGLGYVSNDGAFTSVTESFSLQYRKVGEEGDWTDFGAEVESVTGSTGSPFYKVYRADNVDTTGAQFDVRVKFTAEPASTTRYRTECYFVGIQEIIYDDFSYPGRSVLGLKILANDLINTGTSLTVEAVVTRSTVQVYDGSEWLTKDATIPAWAAWDWHYNPDYGGNVPYSRIVFDAVDDWADWLETKPLYRVNICIDSESTHRSWAEQIAMLGRGAMVQLGTKFTPIVERPEPVGTQRFMFNVSNIRRLSFNEKLLSMEERANCIEVKYKDKDSNYSDQTVTLYAENYNTSDATKTTTVKLIGCDNAAQAFAEAKFRLNKNRYLTNTTTFGANVDALGCWPGNVIDTGHDVPQWGSGGTVVSYTENVTEGDVTTSTVTLDREVDLETGTSYALQIKLNDDSRLEYAVQDVEEATTTNTLTIDGGWDVDGEPDIDCMYQFGPVGSVSKPFTILTIQRADDFTRTIVGLEYNENIFDDDVDVPEVTVYSGLSAVSGLLATEAYTVVGGIPIPRVDLVWRGIASSWTVSYRETNTSIWLPLATVQNPAYSIDASRLSVGTSYEFRVTASGDARTASLYYQGGPTPPDVTGMYEFAQGGQAYIAADSVDLPWTVFYVVKKGTAWATAQLIGEYTTPLAQISGAGTYWMSIRSGAVYSETPSSLTVTADGLDQNIIATFDEAATGFLGDKTEGLVVSDNTLRFVGTGDMYDVDDIWTVPDLYSLGGFVSSGTYTIPDAHIVEISEESLCGVVLEYEMRGESVTGDIYTIEDMWTVLDLWGVSGQFVTARPEVSVYRDGDWGEWSLYRAGDYYGSKFKARILLATSDSTVTPVVSALTFSVDVPDRIDSEKGATISVDGYTFTHTKKFNAVPATIVQLLDAQVGDVVSVPESMQSESGGFVRILNGGSGVARTANLIHRGY